MFLIFKIVEENNITTDIKNGSNNIPPNVYSGQSEPLNPVQSEPCIPAQSEPPIWV